MSGPDALAPIFADAFITGDQHGLASVLLHRVQMEDGLALHVGRDAVLAELGRIAAGFTGRGAGGAAQTRVGDHVLLRMSFAGHCVDPSIIPGCNQTLDDPMEARFGRHLWLRLEAGRIASILAITDWSMLGVTLELDLAPIAAAHGAAHPTHRPLGELASGRGQLRDAPAGDPAPLAERWVTVLNARALRALDPLFAPTAVHWLPGGVRGGEDVRADWWLRLFARVPDARLTLDRTLVAGDRVALLWRLQGHVGTRRVSLPGSTMLRVEDQRIAGEELRFDELALAATAYRPFWPD